MKYLDEKNFDKDNIFGKGTYNSMFAQYFTGDSYLNFFTNPMEGELPLYNVTFAPGCRNNWHTHKASKGGGQILICVTGEGWYQEEGKEAISLKPGSVVKIPANVKHWHGAKKDSWFSHLGIEVPGENTENVWHEKVSDLEFEALKE
jgi:quercetin dioxygenase-like cupin family protein